MADFILREEENRYQVFVETNGETRNVGYKESEAEARELWCKSYFFLNAKLPYPEYVDLYQSRTCSGDKPFLLKKGTKLD